MSQFPLLRTACPPLARITQALPRDRVDDVRGFVRHKLIDGGLGHKVKKGDRIAITGSSRGFGGFIELLCGICDAVRQVGGEPFLIPSMGSHGGATAEGQVEILRRIGVTPETVPAEILATMDTVEMGLAESGAMAHLDRNAAGADGIIILGRTQLHPENTTGIASGLLKMTTAGLGKQAGAREAHSHGLWESVRSIPKVTLGHANVLFGVTVVENPFREAAIVEVVPGTYDAFFEVDSRLLKLAHKFAARIPFDPLDLLIVDEMGKDISGTGMDVNVTGKWRSVGGDRKPDFRRIVPLSLTPASLGNGIGIGLADFTTRRLAEEYDQHVTLVNVLTASEPGGMNSIEAGMPPVLPSDRDAIEVALHSSMAVGDPRVCRIKNTAELDEMWVSPALLVEAGQKHGIKIESQLEPLAYDADGNLRL